MTHSAIRLPHHAALGYDRPIAGWIASERASRNISEQMTSMHHVVLPRDIGQVSFETVISPNHISFGVFDFDIQTPLELCGCPALDAVLINFTLSGCASTRMGRNGRPYSDLPGQIALIAPHGSSSRDILFSSAGHHRFVQIAIPERIFAGLAGEASISLDQFQRRKLEQRSGSILDQRQITPRMAVVLDQLRTMPETTPYIRSTYLHGKLLELFALYAESWQLEPSRRPTVKLQPAVIDRVEKARAILLADLAEAPSVDELAAQVRLGASTLRQAFRAYYGETVYRFLTRQRMNKARTLILEMPWRNVGDIGFEVGFNCASRFSAVFSKTYGMTPKGYRESCRELLDRNQPLN